MLFRSINIADGDSLSARYLITELRQEGWAIYKNAKSINGVTTPVYRLGTPSRAMVAAAFKSVGSSIFA